MSKSQEKNYGALIRYLKYFQVEVAFLRIEDKVGEVQ